MSTKRLSRLWRCGVVAALLALPAWVKAEDCVLSVAQPVVDMGDNYRAQMEPAGEGLLVGKRLIALSISCQGNTGMGLSFAGEPVDERGYRFARSGLFTLKVVRAQLDGQSVQLVNRASPESGQQTGTLFRPGMTLVPYAQGQVVRGQQLNVQFELASYVTEQDTLVSQKELWEGRGQFVLDEF